MRRVAASVVVIAACDGDERDAMTKAGVTAAGDEPPALLVCLQQSARVTSLIARSRAFSVNVLAETAEAVGRRFADAGDDSDSRFHAGAWRAGKTGAPILDGALASFECEVERTVDYGASAIVLGRVLSIGLGETHPLLHCDGFFRRLSAF